jgi:E3 ubiquitin-protein ligase DOA10
MAYVHEDCILDWIMKKISDAVTVSLPSCEVCHQQYRAHIKQGEKKVNYSLLRGKIAELGKMEMGKSVFMVLMAIFAIFMVLSFSFSIVSGNFFQEGVWLGC